jgi:hypothetical protein
MGAPSTKGRRGYLSAEQRDQHLDLDRGAAHVYRCRRFLLEDELVVDVETARVSGHGAQLLQTEDLQVWRLRVDVALELRLHVGQQAGPIVTPDERKVESPVSGISVRCETKVWAELADVHHLDAEELLPETLTVHVELPPLRPGSTEHLAHELEPTVNLVIAARAAFALGADKHFAEHSSSERFDEPGLPRAGLDLPEVVGLPLGGLPSGDELRSVIGLEAERAGNVVRTAHRQQRCRDWSPLECGKHLPNASISPRDHDEIAILSQSIGPTFVRERLVEDIMARLAEQRHELIPTVIFFTGRRVVEQNQTHGGGVTFWARV